MHTRRGKKSNLDNVDRRKEFLDLVERLGQGVVAMGPRDPMLHRDDDEVDREPTPWPRPKAQRR